MIGIILRHIVATAMAAAILSPAAAWAQDSTCRNGFFPDGEGFRQAQVTAKRAFFYEDGNGCPTALACRTRSFVIAGDQLVIDGRQLGGFVCAFYPNEVGGTAGWVQLADLRVRPTDTEPAASRWQGAWTAKGSADVAISGAGNRTVITGNAFWPARPEENEWVTIHIGEVDGPIAITGHRATYGDDNDCQLELTLLADFLLIADNRRCGGVNVTFSGVYVRAD